VLFCDLDFYVEIERRTQPEEFCCQAGVFAGIFCRATFDVFFSFMADKISESLTVPPNKSPEPTAVGACSSAIAVHVASRRWLSFLR